MRASTWYKLDPVAARREIIDTYAGALENGTTINTDLCPCCGGGSTSSKSFSVSQRDGILLWHCYRANCGFSGAFALGAGHLFSKVKVKAKSKSRELLGTMYARDAGILPESIKEKLRTDYCIEDSLIASGKIGWSDGESRLVLPIMDRDSCVVGSVLRSFSGAIPKAITNANPNALAWYMNRSSNSLILVEDQLSAIRSSEYLNAAALLGTNLNDEKVETIISGKFKAVLLALDNDALSTAVGHVLKYRSILPIRLVRLERDIKDMSREQADMLFSGEEYD